MEQQRDNQQKNFMNKGQTSQLNDRVGSNQTMSFDYVVRKTEKLTTALYLVTDIMSDREPMKWKVRETGVDLLSDVTISSVLSASEKMTMLRNIVKKIEKTIAFLDVAQSAHLLSEMNSSVLKREYRTIKSNIESEWNHVYEKSKSIFSDSFFDVPHEPSQKLSSGRDRGAEVRQETQKSIEYAPLATHKENIEQRASTENTVPSKVHHVEDHARSAVAFLGKASPALPPRTNNIGQGQPSAPRVMSNPTGEKITEVRAPMPPPADVFSRTALTTRPSVVLTANQSSGAHDHTPPSFGSAANMTPSRNREMFSRVRNESKSIGHGGQSGVLVQNGPERDDRRKIVLALIKQKPALTVKDIAKSISHVSEKTIQRELLSMVSEGTLVKKGERRWSTYSLRQ